MAKRKADGPVERPRGGRARSVAELVPAAGEAAFRRFGFVQSAIVTRWAEIAGPRYAQAATPEGIRFPPGRRSNGVLLLVAPAAEAVVLQHATPVIIERVNRFFGYAAVERVTIRHGAARPAEALRATAPTAPMPQELGDSLRTVADPELRAVLASLAQGLADRDAAPLVVGRIS